MGYNSNNSKNGNTVVLGKYTFNKEKAMAKTLTYDFLNPAEDFIGIIECKSNIRHIDKRGEMKSDLDVIDCRVIVGYETREEEEQTSNGIYVQRVEKKYENQDVSLVLTKAVLLSKFKKLQDSLQGLTGKRVVIIGLGRAEDKNYYDFYVETEERAKQDGVLQVVSKL